MRLLLALGAMLLAAAPARAATVTVHATDAPGWDLTTVDIQPGDSVMWSFAGTGQAHNVQSASANWSLSAPVLIAGPDVAASFPDEGTYDFVCQVHPDTMRGTVRVTSASSPPPPPPPPPPLSQQPFVNDAAAPVAAETFVALDKAKPKLSAVSARRWRHKARVRFRVSEESVVAIAFKRGKRTVKTVKVAGEGAQRVTVVMRSGRYRVELRATDLAGNRSAATRKTLKL